MDLISQIGKYIALVSFIIGTSLTGLYLHLNRPNSMEELGFFYIVIACVINSIYVLFLVIMLLINKENKFPRIEASLLMLINIPIGLFYSYIIITLTPNL